MNRLKHIHIGTNGFIRATMEVDGIGEVTRQPKLSDEVMGMIEAECLLDLNKVLGRELKGEKPNEQTRL